MRLFNDLRVAYVLRRVGDRVASRILRDEQFVVAARELHVLYDRRPCSTTSFVGCVRYVRREGKAAVLEQRLVEAPATSRSRAGVGGAAARAATARWSTGPTRSIWEQSPRSKVA